MTLHLTCVLEVIKLNNELRVIALFHHNFYIFYNLLKAHNTHNFKAPCPVHLKILTTFNLYSGRPRVGLSINSKQKVRQAVVKMSRGGVATTFPYTPPPPPLATYVGQNGLTIGGLKKEKKTRTTFLVLPSPLLSGSRNGLQTCASYW